MKLMAILAYDVDGVFVCHPIPQRQNRNAFYYKSFMQYQLDSAVTKKCPEQTVNVIIQSENALAHSALCEECSLVLGVGSSVTPPYCPDLRP